MPNKKPLITAWSYSRLSGYKQCPRKFKFKNIDKLKEEGNYAMERGLLVHKKAEYFVKGKITGMPKELKSFGAELKELRKRKALTEIDLAVTSSWKPTTYNDWNKVWCRGYADAVDRSEIGQSTVIDYKTGKIYEESHEEQGKLMATLEMIHNEECESVDVEFFYFDQDDLLSWEYERKDLPKLKRYWKAQVKDMFNDTKFLPCEGDHCRWCYQAKSKGGQCDRG